MKGFILAAAAVLLPLLSQAQWRWAKDIETGDSLDLIHRVNAVVADSDGYVYATGIFRDTVDFGDTTLTGNGRTGFITDYYETYFLAKYAPDGRCLWVRTADTEDGFRRSFGTALALSPDGDLYVGGEVYTNTDNDTFDFGNGQVLTPRSFKQEGFVARYDTDGRCNELLYIGSSSAIEIEELVAARDRQFYIAGTSSGAVSFGDTSVSGLVFAARLDSNLNPVWLIGAAGGSPELAVDSAGYTYLAADYSGTPTFPDSQTLTPVGGQDFYIAKYDADGRFIRVRSIGGRFSDGIGDLTLDAAGNLYVTGYFYGDEVEFGNGNTRSSGSVDMFIAKYDSSDNCSWVRQVGAYSNLDRGRALEIGPNGQLYAAGMFFSLSGFGADNEADFGNGQIADAFGYGDIYIAKYDTTGNCFWVRNAGGKLAEYTNGLAVSRGGVVSVGGSSQGQVSGVLPGDRTRFGQLELLIRDRTAGVIGQFKEPAAIRVELTDTPRLAACQAAGGELVRLKINIALDTLPAGDTVRVGYSSDALNIAVADSFVLTDSLPPDTFLTFTFNRRLYFPGADTFDLTVYAGTGRDIGKLDDTVRSNLIRRPVPRLRSIVNDSVCREDTVLLEALPDTVSANGVYWFATAAADSMLFADTAWTTKLMRDTSFYLVAYDSLTGCRDTTPRIVFAHLNPTPVPGFDFKPACQFDTITFNDRSYITEGSYEQYWYLGNGEYDSLVASTRMAYVFDSDYYPNLRVVSDKGCEADTTITLSIRTQPEADFVFAGSFCAADTVFFTDLSEGASDSTASYRWIFGDGQSDTSYSAYNIYSTADTFRVQMIVESYFGCIDSAVDTVVTLPLPEPGFTAEDLGEQIAEFVPADKTLKTYYWQFGDGEDGFADDTVRHEYADSGFYTVRLTVTDSNGCRASGSETLTILPNGLGDLRAAAYKLYPNPTAGRLVVELADPPVAPVNVMIYNTSGQVVYSRRPASDRWGLDLGHLPAGVYTLRLQVGDKTAYRRIIKR